MNLMTVRNEQGTADLVPFLRRDAGDKDAPFHTWERKAAAVELARRGWGVDRVSTATGLDNDTVRQLLGMSGPRERTPEQRARLREARRALVEQRRSERVLVCGRWIHPRARHGTLAGYKEWLCRCGPCTNANADDCARRTT